MGFTLPHQTFIIMPAISLWATGITGSLQTACGSFSWCEVPTWAQAGGRSRDAPHELQHLCSSREALRGHHQHSAGSPHKGPLLHLEVDQARRHVLWQTYPVQAAAAGAVEGLSLPPTEISQDACFHCSPAVNKTLQGASSPFETGAQLF